jgi:transposase
MSQGGRKAIGTEAGGAPRASAPQAALGERAAPSVRRANGEAGPERARVGPPVGSGAAAAAPSAPQRWSAQRKRDLVLRLLRGEALESVSRETGVEVYRLEEWKKRALAGMEAGLREREERGQAELGAAMKRVGELTMENELLRMRIERNGPFVWRRSRP